MFLTQNFALISFLTFIFVSGTYFVSYKEIYMYFSHISSAVVNRPLQIWVLPTVLHCVLNTKQAREAKWALPRPNAPLCGVPQGRHLAVNGALPQPPPGTLPDNGGH